jgi:hypothetical protein
MKTYQFIFIFCILGSIANGQINQYDTNGKKHGKWIVYWDVNWKKTDSVHAVYARYDFFHHGQTLQPMGPCGAKGYMLEEKPISNIKIGDAKLLDGEYTWYDQKGKIRFVLIIHKGEFVKYTEYRSSGILDQVFDYTKHYADDQPYSWAITTYTKKGERKNIGYGGLVFGKKASAGRD